MITKKVEVTVLVDVTIDETKFDNEFMEEYRGYMDESFLSQDNHIMNIASLKTLGLLMPFTEGYGVLTDMGISADIEASEAEIVGQDRGEG
jgi:hypothetical protein